MTVPSTADDVHLRHMENCRRLPPGLQPPNQAPRIRLRRPLRIQDRRVTGGTLTPLTTYAIQTTLNQTRHPECKTGHCRGVTTHTPSLTRISCLLLSMLKKY